MNRIPDGAGRWRRWATAVGAGLVFMTVLAAVQWSFAGFMLTDGARNAFFAADIWDYNSSPGPWQYEFWGSRMTFAAVRGTVLIAGRVRHGGPVVGQLDGPGAEIA